MANLYPVYMNLEDKNCVVIGGGNVAERKVENLLKCGGKVTVVSPDITNKLNDLLISGHIKYINREYEDSDVEDAFIVICATDSEQINKKVANKCFEHNILVNVVDVPPLCNFYVPSVVRQGDLAISISTNGKSPGLAKKIRKDLERLYGSEYELFLEMMGEAREKVLAQCDNPRKRKEIFTSLVESDILELLKKGEYTLAKERISLCLSSL